MLKHSGSCIGNADPGCRKKRPTRIGRGRSWLVPKIPIAAVVLLLLSWRPGYGATMQDVSNAVAAATAGNCTGEAQQYSSNNKIGFTITQKCFHPGNVMGQYNVWLGNDCMDGFGNHFSGGPYTGFGCNYSFITWAYACDGTTGMVTITPSTSVYRRCFTSTVTMYCDGSTTQTGGYLDLGMDCSALTTSPCPVGNRSTPQNCYTSAVVGTIYPVCDLNDPCCGDPTCDNPEPNPPTPNPNAPDGPPGDPYGSCSNQS